MDPNEALRMLREWVKDVRADYHEEAFTERDAAELFAGLDEWITNGGFLPADWGERAPVVRNSDGSWSFSPED